MNFDFENKDEFIIDDQQDNEIKSSAEEEFLDISSNSQDSGVNFVSSYSTNSGKKKRDVKRITINTVTSVILAISLIFTTVMGWFLASADSSLTGNPLLKLLFGGAKYGDIGYEDEGMEETGEFGELMISDSKDVTYFLVVGCDWTDSKQTDVIVVVCMDHKNDTVSMLQIPRDTYVGYLNAYKINSVFPNAQQGELKINALRRCLSNQLGIPIDHYILFSIEGAVNVVDAIGGVEMNFPNPIRIEDPLDFGTYYNIGPGKVLLSGKDAIGFMRKRSGNQSEDQNYDGSDIGRVKQQRKFYAALFKELQNMSKSEIWKIANSCFNQIQTDLTLNQTVAFALAAMKLDTKNIHIFGMPGQACYYNGVSYYSIHKDDYVKVFNEYFNPYGEELTEDSVACPEIYKLAGYAKNENWLTGEDSTLDEY